METIPITIEGLTFNISATKEKREQFNLQCKKISEQTITISKHIKAKQSAGLPIDKETMDMLDNFASSNLDELLGDGAFDKLFEKMPSSAALGNMLQHIIASLPTEFNRILGPM